MHFSADLTLKDGNRGSYSHFLDHKRPTQPPRIKRMNNAYVDSDERTHINLSSIFPVLLTLGVRVGRLWSRNWL